MALDLKVVAVNLGLIATAVLAFMLFKAAGIYTVARIFRSSHHEAVDRASLMAQGGEFAFVLYAAAASAGIINAATNAIFTATVIISMALTPLVTAIVRRLQPEPALSMDGIETPDGLTGNVLIIGFGRFGQIVSQPLLARGMDVSIIDNDIEMIQAAAQFGFKVYYGDGSRLDILHAAGAENAQAVMICVDGGETAVHIAELLRSEFPLVPVMARSFDRRISLKLIEAGVDYQMRETIESAFAFGFAALMRLGVAEEEASEVIDQVRRRDEQRLELQIAEGFNAGRQLFQGNQPKPMPLTTPRRAGRAGNAETAAILAASAGSEEPTEAS
jgi:glutathione-regulated potassium-efflux system protein KefB